MTSTTSVDSGEFKSRRQLPSRFHAAEGCDLLLVRCVESFQDDLEARACAARKRLSSRSVANACYRYVSPALISCLGRFHGVDDVQLLLNKCAPDGIKEAFESAASLHKLVDKIDWNVRPDALGHGVDMLDSFIDTLRNAAAFLACWPRSQRIKTEEDRGKKGGKQRLRSAEEQWSLSDWPYCEHCWKLAQRAARLERDAGLTEPSLLIGLSERFCTDHVPEEGTRYWSARRTKDRFRLLVDSIYREIGTNSGYRMRFKSPEDDAAWRYAQRVTKDDLELWGSRDLPAISPIQMRVRFVAFEISRHLPRQVARAVEIASLKRLAVAQTGKSLTLSEIANKLGVTKQEISRRAKIGGFVEFDVTSEDLRWWPFEDSEPRNAIRLRPAAESVCSQVGWHASVSGYLREIYSTKQSSNWKSLEALKLA